MAMINDHNDDGHDDATQDNGDHGLAELHRIIAEHNHKTSASAILSQTLKRAHDDDECGGAHICEEDESDDDIAMAGGDEPFKERTSGAS